MPKRITRFIFASLATLAILFLALEVFAHVNRSKTLSVYYRLERKWESRWPVGHVLMLARAKFSQLR